MSEEAAVEGDTKFIFAHLNLCKVHSQPDFKFPNVAFLLLEVTFFEEAVFSNNDILSTLHRAHCCH